MGKEAFVTFFLYLNFYFCRTSTFSTFMSLAIDMSLQEPKIPTRQTHCHPPWQWQNVSYDQDPFLSNYGLKIHPNMLKIEAVSSKIFKRLSRSGFILEQL